MMSTWVFRVTRAVIAEIIMFKCGASKIMIITGYRSMKLSEIHNWALLKK